MSSIFLTSYIIRLCDRNSHEMLPVDNFQNGADLFDIIGQRLNSLRTSHSNDADLQRSLRVMRYSASARTTTGVIQSGAYGFESDIFDTQSGIIAHHKTINEADFLPFYFLVHIPNNGNEGILILQRFGINGIKTVFTKYFSDYFIEHHPDIMFEINPLIPEDFISNIMRDARFTEIRFIKFGIPTDFADVYAGDGHIEREGYFQQSITVPKRGSLRLAERILDVLNGRRDVKTMYELPNEYDNVKVEVELNGRYRVMDLSHPERFRPTYDISQEVEIGADGHPVFDSINGIARGLLNDISSTIGNTNV